MLWTGPITFDVYWGKPSFVLLLLLYLFLFVLKFFPHSARLQSRALVSPGKFVSSSPLIVPFELVARVRLHKTFLR